MQISAQSAFSHSRAFNAKARPAFRRTRNRTKFAYDNLNRLTGYVPATTSQSYGYDLTGNRTSSTIGSSSYTDTIASTSNRLSSTTGPAPTRTNSYDADGNLTGDGTYTYTYSARGRFETFNASIGDVGYRYNGLGQRTYKGGATTQVTTGANRYAYDEGGRLLGEYDIHAQPIQETVYLGDTPIAVVTPNGPAVILDNSDSTVTTTGTWSTSTSDAGYLGPNYAYPTASTGTLTWPLVIGTSGSYHVYARWTADTNRSTAAAYTVGSNAAVHENQTTNGSKWVMLGTYTLSTGTTNVTLTADTSGTVIADAIKAVLVSQDGVTSYHIYPDQIDTPRVITRPSDNQMVWRWDQADPFGSATPNQNPASLGAFVYNPRFPGQLFDSEDNLVYNYARNYDPTLGRYVQSDPSGLAGNDLTTYSYVNDRPLNFIDPTGLMGVGSGAYNGNKPGYFRPPPTCEGKCQDQRSICVIAIGVPAAAVAGAGTGGVAAAGAAVILIEFVCQRGFDDCMKKCSNGSCPTK